MRKIIYCIALSLLLVGCSTATKNFFKQFIGEDPDPPAGYNPIFITETKDISQSKLLAPSLTVTRVEPYKGDAVKVYMHLIDSNKTFLSGAAEKEHQKIWCEVIDSCNGEEKVIKKFTIRESRKNERAPQAIAMIMDHSGSMGDNRARAVQTAVDNFIKTKHPDDAVTLVKYDDSCAIEVGLTRSQSDLMAKFKKEGLTGWGGETATANAIILGLTELQKADPNLQKIVMVFTDGMDNKSTISKDSVIALARKLDAYVCSIDYGVNTDENFMKYIASKTNGSYNHIYKAKEFDLVFKDIYTRLENFYVLEYEPEDFGAHKIKMKLCMDGQTLAASGEFDNKPYSGLINNLNVYFQTDKSTLLPSSNDAIDKVYKMLKTNPTVSIELRGHTDNQNRTKDPNYNTKLSQSRADEVKKALVKKGISADRITAIGFGDTQPIADNKTEAGRAKNRRTELVIIK